MKKGIILIACFFVLISCKKRLDDFLFNADNSITEYKLDFYEGEKTIEVTGSYFIPDHMIHQFAYAIEDEGKELEIQAIFTGDITRIDQDTVLLFCHGNRDHMDHYWPKQKVYSHLGKLARFGVLMIDYPGYGLSDGKTTEENMYASVEGALDWLKERGLTDDRLVMIGFSLGSAPTCKIAAGDFSMKPSKMVLEAPFASAEVMVQDAAALAMPSSFFVDLKIDNAEQVKNTDVPLLWLHGTEDDFLTIEKHGEVVYKNHQGAFKEAHRIPGAGHSSVPTFMGLDEYSKTILDFILKE